MGNGGSEGDDDLKSNDDVDDAEIEGHAISSDPEPDADDWDFDIHNPPLTSIPRAPGPARADGDTEATGTGTSTPVTEAALKELEGTEELKINIDWALMNDEFDAWMEGDSSDEGEEGGGERKPKQAASGNGGPKNMDVSEDDWTDETNSTIRWRRISALIPIPSPTHFFFPLAHRGPNANVCVLSHPPKLIPLVLHLRTRCSVLLCPSGRNSQQVGLVRVPS